MSSESRTESDRPGRAPSTRSPSRQAEILAQLDKEREQTAIDQASRRLVKAFTPARQDAVPLGRSIETVFGKSGLLTPQRQAEMKRAEEHQAAVDHELAVKNLRTHSGVFPRYAAATLGDVEYVRERLNDEEFRLYLRVRDQLASLADVDGTVVLSGDNGPGKTHLASALVNGFCAVLRAARYVRAIDFFRAIKSTFGQPGRTAEELIGRFTAYRLLVIDEIDVRSDSTWENNELRSLIDARYGHQVSTVLVTNRTKAELNGADGSAPYLSRSLRDRIRQEGGILECTWRSLRGEAGR